METFPVLSQTPSFPIPCRLAASTDILSYNDKLEQRAANWTDFGVTWTFSYYDLPTADKELFENFFIARLGMFGKFYWINPLSGVTFTVRFDMEEPNIQYAGYNLWNITDIKLKGRA